MILFFVLDQLAKGAESTIGTFLTFLVQCMSFAGIFILLWGLFQGIVLDKWRYHEFLLSIIILGLVGVEPAWALITNGFPDFSTLFNVGGVLP